MQLINLTVDEFLEDVSLGTLSPAGGSVCALCGSLGASLSEMVCNVTLVKHGYEEHYNEVSNMLDNITNIKSKLCSLIDNDKEAFDKVHKVIKMPRSTDKEILYRKNAMDIALKDATIVPFKMLYLCSDLLEAVEQAVNITNKNSLADLGVAVVALKAGVEGAYLTINFNLSRIKDEKFVDEYKNASKQLYERSLKISDMIYFDILDSI